MSLADALNTPSPRRRATRCVLGRIIDSLSTEDGNALVGALNDDRFTTSHIHRALLDEGHQLGRSAVEIHRKGGCACLSRTP